MQLLPRYLVQQHNHHVSRCGRIHNGVQTSVYKQLQLYKGIDNVLEFRLLNADQKPVDITSYTPKFVAFDETNQMVLEKDVQY